MTDPTSTRFVILLAGAITPTPRLRAQTAGAHVIAADGGIAHAGTLDLTPELWVGDFDSSNETDGDAFPGMVRQAHPALKAETDGALAVEEARKRGATQITLVGAFGGRTDHSFAVMTQAAALGAEDVSILLTDGREEAHPLSPEPQTFDYPSGTTFSVLAFSALEGLTLTGAQWPLDAITMPFGDTLTISNTVDGQLTATLTKGIALLLAQLEP
ncbi:MAG: thiamine diphosphokinase [Pseudomonadota bacterium]